MNPIHTVLILSAKQILNRSELPSELSEVANMIIASRDGIQEALNLYTENLPDAEIVATRRERSIAEHGHWLAIWSVNPTHSVTILGDDSDLREETNEERAKRLIEEYQLARNVAQEANACMGHIRAESAELIDAGLISSDMFA